MKKNKILFIHHLSVVGGATKSLFDLVHYVKLNGYDPSVLFYGKQGNAFSWFKKNKIKCYNFENGKTFQHANGAYIPILQKRPYRVFTIFLKAIFSIRETKDLISKINPDLVYLNTSLLFPAAIASKLLNIRVVWHIREQLHDGVFGLRNFFLRKCFTNFSDKLICISKTNAKKIRAKCCNVIYNSTDHDMVFKSNKISMIKKRYNIKDQKVILFLGGNVKSKGADILFKAISKLALKNPNFILLVVGKFSIDKMQSNRIEKRVINIVRKNKIILENVRFTGVLEDVRDVLQISDILVWPAKTSHFARPIIEAMMTQTLVVASDFESTREIIENGNTGFLVKPDYLSFFNCLNEILSKNNFHEEITFNAKEKAISLFHKKNNLKINLDLINELF